jgi:hypothetical protein
METKGHKIMIQEMYPQLNAEEQAEAAACLAQYVEVTSRIYKRNQDLTEMDHPATI